FFQAEDGIRDATVTGVQTCALPISPKHRLMISKLAAILRLADALDHEHASTVDAVEVDYKRPRFLFRLKGKGDMLLEKWALVNKRDLFENVFDANVVVEDLAS